MTDAENTLTLETTKGKVVILMRPDLAPGHVARIKELDQAGRAGCRSRPHHLRQDVGGCVVITQPASTKAGRRRFQHSS